MASGAGSAAVDVASGVVDGVGSAVISGDEESDAEFESVESSEVAEKLTGWVVSGSEAQAAKRNNAPHTDEMLTLFFMTKPTYMEISTSSICA